MDVMLGVMLGFCFWFIARYAIGGFYTIGPNERAVLCTFGRAQRLGELSTLGAGSPGGTSGAAGNGSGSSPAKVGRDVDAEERERYNYPQVRVIGPGFYWKLPWQSLHRASVATSTVSIAFDPEDPRLNAGGQVLDAVTKDQLNTGLSGQLRYTVTERNLYAFLFGVRSPVAHVMGYFVSILRNRIANFEAPAHAVSERPGTSGGAGTSSADAADSLGGVQGISINDLRKNLRDLNEGMDRDCAGAALRYGVQLDAALITGIDPPAEVDSALAAINTAHNHVSSEISLAQAAADQRIVQSRRAVEIETLNAQAEVEPLLALANQLGELAGVGGPGAVDAYVRNAKLALYRKAKHLLLADESGGFAAEGRRR